MLEDKEYINEYGDWYQNENGANKNVSKNYSLPFAISQPTMWINIFPIIVWAYEKFHFIYCFYYKKNTNATKKRQRNVKYCSNNPIHFSKSKIVSIAIHT